MPRYAVTGATKDDAGVWTVTTKGTVTFLKPGHGIDIAVTDPTFTIAADGTGSVVADGRGAAQGSPTSVPFTRQKLFDIVSSVTPATAGGVRTFADVQLRVAAGASQYLSYAAGTAYGSFSLEAAIPAIERSSLTWTQTKYFASGDVARTWLGYLTRSGTGPAFAAGTMTPSEGATGDTVEPASPAGPDERYAVRYAATESTVDAAAKTGVLRLKGLVTFRSVAHGITITVEDPRVQLDGTNTAKLFATGVKTTGIGTTAPYDESVSVFDLTLGDAVVNGDGTATFAAVAPRITQTGYAFPADYPATGETRTAPFGSFAITVPSGS